MAIHVVRSGETLWAISNFYGVSISSIVRDNGLMSIDSIVPGLALYIPENRTSLYQRYYQIKAGDQLWMLAPAFSNKCGTDSTCQFRNRPLSVKGGTNVGDSFTH